MQLKHKLTINPAWDKRNPDPKKNYGIHGVNMLWTTSGKLGTVQFLLYTNWLPSKVEAEYTGFEEVKRFLLTPLPADIGYHSRVPLYEGQTPMRKAVGVKTKKMFLGNSEVEVPVLEQEYEFMPCEHLQGDPCFYDGSSLGAKEFFNILVDQGEEALKLRLEEYYNSCLGIELSPWKYYYVFKTIDDTWFYIYRHVNNGWEKSKEFNTLRQALVSKFKVTLKVHFKKVIKFVKLIFSKS